MNTDEQQLIWFVGVGVVALAAVALYLRDRYRDSKDIPQSTRTLAEQRNAAGGAGFAFVALGLISIARLAGSSGLLEKGFWLLTSALLFWVSVGYWKKYLNLRSKR